MAGVAIESIADGVAIESIATRLNDRLSALPSLGHETAPHHAGPHLDRLRRVAERRSRPRKEARTQCFAQRG